MRRPRLSWSFLNRLLLLLLVGAPLLTMPLPGATAPTYVGVAAVRERLTLLNGLPFFVCGFNNEGPQDRAWRMLEDAEFDPGLIEQDLIRVQGLGLNTV